MITAQMIEKRNHYEGTSIPRIWFEYIKEEDIPSFNGNLEDYIYTIINLTKEFDTNGPYDECCGICRNRSVGDIFRLGKTYYNDLTLQDTMRTLFKLSHKLTTFRCWDINKRVFYVTPSEYNDYDNEHDEYDLKFYQWEDITIKDSQCVYGDLSEEYYDDDDDEYDE